MLDVAAGACVLLLTAREPGEIAGCCDAGAVAAALGAGVAFAGGFGECGCWLGVCRGTCPYMRGEQLL